MYLSELKQIAYDNGESQTLVTRTIGALTRASNFHILEPKYGIRRERGHTRWGKSVNPEDFELYDNLRRDINLGRAEATIEEVLEEWPEPYDRLQLRNYGPQAEQFFMYLLERYYQPSQTVYERRDTYGGEYDI